MPRADYGPLSQGSRHYFRAISPITQPQDSRGATPAHSPGLRSLLRGHSRPPAGLNHETATHPHQCRPALHAPWTGSLFSPRPWEETVFFLGAQNHLPRLPKGLDGLSRLRFQPILNPRNAQGVGREAADRRMQKRVANESAGWKEGAAAGVVQCQRSLAHPTKARTRQSFAHRDPIAPGLPRRLLRPVRLRLWPLPETNWFSNK